MNEMMLLVPILLPMLFGACLPLFHFVDRSKRERYVAIPVILNSLLVFGMIFCHSSNSLTLVSLMNGLTIALRMDGLSCVFAGLVAALWPLATFYAFEYIKHEGNDNKFFTFYTMTYGVTVGIALSANMVTMYFFYELLTLITLPLVMHAMDRRAILAGRKYLIYSIFGAAMAFSGIMILAVYGSDPSLTFTFGGFVSSVQDTTAKNALLVGYLLTFFGFGVKAAVFPFHGWLPAAGVAPTPVTALLHAVAVVKAGVFALMRSTYYCFGMTLLAGTWVQNMAMFFAIVTIVFGSTMAWKEQHIKRRLAYSTISNLSYIVFGITMMTPLGLSAAMSHMLFHGIIKITLFFCAGAIMYKTHKEYVVQFDGFGAKMPITFIAFTVGSMALTGIPLLPGFISKYNLATAALETGSTLAFVGVVALLISAILTAAYLFTVVIRAYFPGNEFQGKKVEGVHDPNGYMCIPFVILCVMMFILGMYPNVIMHMLHAICGVVA